ncbi:unnamed protein product, partial [Arctogadus glacialis]
ADSYLRIQTKYFRPPQTLPPELPFIPPSGFSAWTYYKMDNGFQNGTHSFLCKLLNGAGQHQGEICFRIMGP